MRKYLSIADLLEIHKELIDEFGGIHGVRDINSVESSVMRPQVGYYNNIIEEAAALMESLAMNHSFLDGNKRVSFFAADVFLRINGFYISCDSEEANDFYVRNLSEHNFSFKVIFDWLEKQVKNI